MTAARHLAAILAADVVGYSRLMGEDESGAAKAVRERREAVTSLVRTFGGRLVKTTGDGVLLEFPSVVAAVECAILIQKMMEERNAGLIETKRVVYRVGVHLGDVLIEGDDILGDGVNVAARLKFDRRARRRVLVGVGLRTCRRPDRSRVRRSRRTEPQEHRQAHACRRAVT